MMEMAQMQSMMGQGQQNGAGSPIAGAGGPGQEPGSPNQRSNEFDRGEQQGAEEQSTAMAGAPNLGAQ